MEIMGLQKLTLLDFPGRMACTVFTGGCNFRCPFCHNASLVIGPEYVPLMTEDEFFELPAVNVNTVVNTVGAGDALFSGFMHYYAKGFSPIECLKRAEIFASYKIGFDGAAVGFCDEEKLEKMVKQHF